MPDEGRIFQNRPTQRLPADGLRWLGTMREFRKVLRLQRRVLLGELGGSADGLKVQPPDRR